jgi:hypothetical protein
MCRFRSALRLPCAPPRFIALAPCGLHESRAASAPGADPAINKAFQQPDVAGWAGRLEGESRETYARRDRGGERRDDARLTDDTRLAEGRLEHVGAGPRRRRTLVISEPKLPQRMHELRLLRTIGHRIARQPAAAGEIRLQRSDLLRFP